jgi:hypothetical protein
MDSASVERKLGRTLRVMPVVVLALLAVSIATGGFSNSSEPSAIRDLSHFLFTVFIAVGPLIFIAAMLLIERLRRVTAKNLAMHNSKLDYSDAFNLPSQEMHGYKIAFITDHPPTFAGLTGDRYTQDAAAKCLRNTEHVPPVAGCECGFYAYNDIRRAHHELSINPGAFFIDVDLFGVGFAYTHGFKAESQLVNFLTVPKRCMRCKTLPAKKFVAIYKMNYASFAYWQWEFRCSLCSYSFKEQDSMSIDEMSKALNTPLR